MSILSHMTDLLALKLTILLQSVLPNLGFLSVILALMLIGCSFLWLWAVEKAIKLEICDETDVEEKHLGLGPSYGTAARLMMWIGGIHLALNVFCALLGWVGALDDVMVYGPQGMLLDAMGLASLAPLP